MSLRNLILFHFIHFVDLNINFLVHRTVKNKRKKINIIFKKEEKNKIILLKEKLHKEIEKNIDNVPKNS